MIFKVGSFRVCYTHKLGMVGVLLYRVTDVNVPNVVTLLRC